MGLPGLHTALRTPSMLCMLCCCAQARMFHEATQSDDALFNRLCPADPAGGRRFAPVMLRRLAKLGIGKTDPNDLTAEERSRWGRGGIGEFGSGLGWAVSSRGSQLG